MEIDRERDGNFNFNRLNDQRPLLKPFGSSVAGMKVLSVSVISGVWGVSVIPKWGGVLSVREPCKLFYEDRHCILSGTQRKL